MNPVITDLWKVYFFWAAVAWVVMALRSWRLAWNVGVVKTFVTVTICAVAWPHFLSSKIYFR